MNNHCAYCHREFGEGDSRPANQPHNGYLLCRACDQKFGGSTIHTIEGSRMLTMKRKMLSEALEEIHQAHLQLDVALPKLLEAADYAGRVVVQPNTVAWTEFQGICVYISKILLERARLSTFISQVSYSLGLMAEEEQAEEYEYRRSRGLSVELDDEGQEWVEMASPPFGEAVEMVSAEDIPDWRGVEWHKDNDIPYPIRPQG